MNRVFWREMVTENPMLIEIARFRRRFLSFSGSNSMNGVVLGLALVCYLGLLLLVFSSRGAIPPVGLVMFQTFIYTLVTPSMLYGAIAGEREKRTWDLLLAAPITPGQIVVGKFIGALVAISVGFGLFLVPILVTAVQYQQTRVWDLFLAELVSISFVIALSAVTLFFSARTRRSFMALGTVLATLAIVLIIVPLLTSSLVPEILYVDLVNFFHPFYVLTKLYATSEGMNVWRDGMKGSAWGVPQVIGYLGLSVIFLLWAAKTLTFAENEVNFLATNSHA
jgi:ABC-type transport system involved in multi-copper enzyme maturation permease subunit